MNSISKSKGRTPGTLQSRTQNRSTGRLGRRVFQLIAPMVVGIALAFGCAGAKPDKARAPVAGESSTRVVDYSEEAFKRAERNVLVRAGDILHNLGTELRESNGTTIVINKIDENGVDLTIIGGPHTIDLRIDFGESKEFPFDSPVSFSQFGVGVDKGDKPRTAFVRVGGP